MTGIAHHPHQVAQARRKADRVQCAEAVRWAHRGSRVAFDHNGAGTAARKALIPVEHVGCHQTVFAGAPRNHSGNPGPLRQRDRSHLDRREQSRGRRFGCGWPASGAGRVPNSFEAGATLAAIAPRATRPSPRFRLWPGASIRATTCTTLITGKVFPMTAAVGSADIGEFGVIFVAAGDIPRQSDDVVRAGPGLWREPRKCSSSDCFTQWSARRSLSKWPCGFHPI